MKVKPMWAKKAEKKMIDLDIAKNKLAKELNINYTQLISVMSGTVINESIANKVCNYLKIER